MTDHLLSHPGDDVADDIQVILPLEDFAEDLEQRLGRANGNIFVRREGVKDVHDGQVMVRLKKKRFIVIDYSIVPNKTDLRHSSNSPYIRCPEGAGKKKCTVSTCNKVGVPVLLYDSDPFEPQSLYLRSGLCFTCQRNLNEKRRTQRKKPAEKRAAAAMDPPQVQAGVSMYGAPHMAMGFPGAAGVPEAASGVLSPYHQVLMAVTGGGSKRIKLAHTNEPLTLLPDAVILNGPPEAGCKTARTHGFQEIGMDLESVSKSSLQLTQQLMHSVCSSDVLQHNQPPPTSEDISRLYDSAFSGLCKSLYLLTQWKESWDGAMTAAFSPEHHHHSSLLDGHVGSHHLSNAIPDIHHPPIHLTHLPPPPPSPTTGGMPPLPGTTQDTPPPPLAGGAIDGMSDALASAAAVAAATAETTGGTATLGDDDKEEKLSGKAVKENDTGSEDAAGQG
ncbi:MAG: hypothetical protein SGARI_003085, partial [Bacillariaceae sp.]